MTTLSQTAGQNLSPSSSGGFFRFLANAAYALFDALGRRAAIERPATHEHLEPRVTPYAKLFFADPSGEELWVLFSVYFFAVMLLVLVCSNVALLLFAAHVRHAVEGDGQRGQKCGLPECDLVVVVQSEFHRSVSFRVLVSGTGKRIAAQ